MHANNKDNHISYVSNDNFFSTLMLFVVTGPEMLIRQSSGLGSNGRRGTYFEGDVADVIEMHNWKCVRTVNGTFLCHCFTHLENKKKLIIGTIGNN